MTRKNHENHSTNPGVPRHLASGGIFDVTVTSSGQPLVSLTRPRATEGPLPEKQDPAVYVSAIAVLEAGARSFVNRTALLTPELSQAARSWWSVRS